MQLFQSILLLDLQASPTQLPESLVKLNRGSLDTLIIEPEPLSIGIDQIKQAIAYASKRPLKHARKSIIFHQAHTLTIEAQNALLKMLEEPPSYLDLLLIATTKHTLLETVLSRCRIIKTPPTSSREQAADPAPLQNLINASPPARLALLPKKTTATDAKVWCFSQVHQAKTLYHQHPTTATYTNLLVLTECLTRLKANSNPSIALTDAVLQLTKIN
jgi:hypothetical protein